MTHNFAGSFFGCGGSLGVVFQLGRAESVLAQALVQLGAVLMDLAFQFGQSLINAYVQVIIVGSFSAQRYAAYRHGDLAGAAVIFFAGETHKNLGILIEVAPHLGNLAHDAVVDASGYYHIFSGDGRLHSFTPLYSKSAFAEGNAKNVRAPWEPRSFPFLWYAGRRSIPVLIFFINLPWSVFIVFDAGEENSCKENVNKT
jgi:hypothetical protein